MSFQEKQKKKWGDRKDARWVKDAPGLNVIMASLYPHRTDCEVYLNQEVDITELLKFVESKNGPDAPFKTTVFHCFVAMVARILNERHYLNRFIQGRRIYERNDITVSFVAKRRFADHSEEALMQYVAKPKDTVEDISRIIVGDVHEMRKESHAHGIDNVISTCAKLPRFLLIPLVGFIRFLDFWGLTPEAFSKGDSNCASVVLSNLGSIKCPAVYHHLNNYGTTSVLMTIGTYYKKEITNADGTKEVRDFVELGTTVDERIADGFYFARSLKLIQHICYHPEILDQTLEEDSGYEFV